VQEKKETKGSIPQLQIKHTAYCL